MNKRAEFGFGIGKLQDNYFQSSVINFEEDRSDRSLYRLIGGSISFYGSTLNSRQYATKGYNEKLIAQIFTGKKDISLEIRQNSLLHRNGNHGYRFLI